MKEKRLEKFAIAASMAAVCVCMSSARCSSVLPCAQACPGKVRAYKVNHP